MGSRPPTPPTSPSRSCALDWGGWGGGGDALFVADREAFKQRARQAAQDLGHAEAGQGGPEPYLSLDDVKTESSPMVQNLQKQLLDALARSDKPEFNRLLSLLVAEQQAARKDEK
jgi:hypothetical protein